MYLNSILIILFLSSCSFQDSYGKVKSFLKQIFGRSTEVTVDTKESCSEGVDQEEGVNQEETKINISSALDIMRAISIVDKLFCGDKISEDRLVGAALKGVMSELNDPYSCYLDEKEFSDLCTSYVESSFEGGIGIMYIKTSDQSSVLVVQVIEGSPAEVAGLVKGDKIVAINDKSVYGIDRDEVVNHIKGKNGTSVTLSVVRRGERDKNEKDISKSEGEREVKFVVKRDKISLDNVASKMLDDEIGYILLRRFSVDVDRDVKLALKNLKSKGAKYIILDLRDNPGGILESGIAVSSIFIDKSPIVGQKSLDIEETFASLGDADSETPLVLLVNGGSASASEITAGALKDYNRALIIGERTYGKGTVQSIIPLNGSDHKKGAIKLTTAKFFTPNGTFIHKVGVEPHIYVGRDSSTGKYILDNESNALVKFEDYYIELLTRVDEQKEIQLQTAINLIKSLKGDFTVFLGDSDGK